MKRLVFAVDTLPVINEGFERGFSRMNVICYPLRKGLRIAHLSIIADVCRHGRSTNEQL